MTIFFDPVIRPWVEKVNEAGFQDVNIGFTCSVFNPAYINTLIAELRSCFKDKAFALVTAAGAGIDRDRRDTKVNEVAGNALSQRLPCCLSDIKNMAGASGLRPIVKA